MDSTHEEAYISVDVETAGPHPGAYSLLSIGACFVFEPKKQFYVELKPINLSATEEALRISRLNLEELSRRGLAPHAALEQFASWVHANIPQNHEPVFVGFNAPFDWMFIAEYFHRYLGHNPFGHKALDIKAYFMGMKNARWKQTGYESIANHYHVPSSLSHNALDDAMLQARVFRAMLEERPDRFERM